MLEKEERINSKKDLKEWLAYERKSYGLGGGVKRFLSELLNLSEKEIIVKYQRRLRIYEYHLNTGHRIRSAVYHAKVNRIGLRYGLLIGPNVCGKGLMIMHLGSILVNGDSRIGKNCKLHINTAIVGGGTDKRSPYLGDNIVVGVGATLLGGIKIANGVGIGAGAVVNKDITEENIAVAGVPAHKISNNGSDKW